jgi:hypothetical protein
MTTEFPPWTPNNPSGSWQVTPVEIIPELLLVSVPGLRGCATVRRLTSTSAYLNLDCFDTVIYHATPEAVLEWLADRTFNVNDPSEEHVVKYRDIIRSAERHNVHPSPAWAVVVVHLIQKRWPDVIVPGMKGYMS